MKKYPVRFELHSAYNSRSEAVSAAIGANLYVHAYDGIGNHTLFADNAATNTFTHNNLNQLSTAQETSAPLWEIGYTSDGGISSDGAWDYAYDTEDQLASVTSADFTNGAIRVFNSYDYRHRRIGKTVQRLSVSYPPPPSPPIETREWNTIEYCTFAYDDWNLIHETVAIIDGGTTNTTEVQYFWGLDLSDSLQGAGGVGGLLAVSSNGQFYFPTYDNNGNVTKYIDESGNIAAAYEYDDFGRLVSQAGPLADFFRHRFSTKYFDSETGLYYYGYRFYSPDWRIWLNRDPIGEVGGENLYAFCRNNGICYNDLNGYCTLGTFNVLSLVIDVKPAANGLFINSDFFTNGESLMSSLDMLGNLTAISSFSGSRLANLLAALDYAADKTRTPQNGAIDAIKRLYDNLKKGAVEVFGVLEYELCQCINGKGKYVKQQPLTDSEQVLDSSDASELRNAYDHVRKGLFEQLPRRKRTRR